MVLAHHLVWTVYGYWLPNDPRGSWSEQIRVEPLRKLGDIHHGRKEIQPSRTELQEFQEKARDELAHEVLLFDDEQIDFLGTIFGKIIRDHKYTCYACAVMPEHVHLCICAHRDKAEIMLDYFQEESRDALIQAGIRSPVHSVWGGKGWKRFLNTPKQIVGVIEYIRMNPVKEGRPEQFWDFITRLRVRDM